jgi:hypothetical protein
LLLCQQNFCSLQLSAGVAGRILIRRSCKQRFELAAQTGALPWTYLFRSNVSYIFSFSGSLTVFPFVLGCAETVVDCMRALVMLVNRKLPQTCKGWKRATGYHCISSVPVISGTMITIMRPCSRLELKCVTCSRGCVLDQTFCCSLVIHTEVWVRTRRLCAALTPNQADDQHSDEGPQIKYTHAVMVGQRLTRVSDLLTRLVAWQCLVVS